MTETLALVDERGIAAASMRTVGERLGVRGMSLYRYVPSREALLDAVVERIVDELSADPEVRRHPEQGWRDYLSGLARAGGATLRAGSSASVPAGRDSPARGALDQPAAPLAALDRGDARGVAGGGFHRCADPVRVPELQQLPAGLLAAGDQRGRVCGPETRRRVLPAGFARGRQRPCRSGRPGPGRVEPDSAQRAPRGTQGRRRRGRAGGPGREGRQRHVPEHPSARRRVDRRPL